MSKIFKNEQDWSKMPWESEITTRSGCYDIIIRPFIKMIMQSKLYINNDNLVGIYKRKLIRTVLSLTQFEDRLSFALKLALEAMQYQKFGLTFNVGFWGWKIRVLDSLKKGTQY